MHERSTATSERGRADSGRRHAHIGTPESPTGPALRHRPRGSRSGTGPVMDWERGYRSAVIASDIVMIMIVVGSGALAVPLLLGDGASSALFALPTALALLCAIPARRGWHRTVLGQGVEEYRRLGIGLFSAGVAVAVVAVLLQPPHARFWAFGAVPLAALAVFVSRYTLRQMLHKLRRNGQCMLPVVAAGSRSSIADLLARVADNPYVGWRVEAACIVGEGAADGADTAIAGVPVVGDLDALAHLVRRNGYRVVAVTPDPYWTPQRVQTLAWDLEGTSAELMVAPVVMDIGGTRLRMSGVLGMPMLQVSQPTFTGWQRLIKEVVDRVVAAALLVLLSPVFALIALAIKVTSRGPVFYPQRRVMRDGASFRMWKFRTMRRGAHAEVSDLAAANDAAGPLFKLRTDPRVTAVGRVLRRFSADELPQLFNVLTGSMSLVGPRPPLPEESMTYNPQVGRRLLVKPGMTGLWQVSGRSDLPWEDSVRLDLQYVEDWSLMLDAAILWKTIRAVVGGKGAY